MNNNSLKYIAIYCYFVTYKNEYGYSLLIGGILK